MTRKSFLLLLLLIVNFCGSRAFAQDFLMQGWYWEYPKTASGYNWADTMVNRANAMGTAGFTYVWLPPLSRTSSGSYSNGYDPKDLYDLGGYGMGPTGFGTSAGVANVIAAFNNNNIKTVADVVYNHRDGGAPENNPLVQDYVNNAHSSVCSTNPLYNNPGYSPYPSDRFRYIIPLGGATGNGAGDYYIKISSVSGSSNFFNKPYTFYAQTNTTGWQGQPNIAQIRPDGGGDCGQPNMPAPLGINIDATTANGGCLTDEYHVTLTAADFNAAGDTLYIYITNKNGNYSDHRIYGVWSGAQNKSIYDQVYLQTYTDFSQLPSGQGAMHYTEFHPGGSSCTVMGGDWDYPFFYYDYDQNNLVTKAVLTDWTKWLWNSIGIRGYRMDAVKQFNPAFVGELMTDLNSSGINPGLVVGENYDYGAGNVIGWLNGVESSMSAAAKAAINVRAFDFPLRDALKQACDGFGYDVRNIYNAGIAHNGGGSSRAVTFANNHDLRDPGQPISNDPLLAYTYIFTDNSIGIPTMFYPDYFGISVPNYPTVYLKPTIDSIMAFHKKYIYGSPTIDYLNYSGSSYASAPTNYISSTDGASAATTLIYQLSGGPTGKDIIVAINFAGTTLKVDHQINTHNGSIPAGTAFYDYMKRSNFPQAIVSSNNTIYVELPPRSFSIWINDQSALPVVFNSVGARIKNNRLLVDWSTASEQNNDHFDIELSKDGINFSKIATVKSNATNGSSVSVLNYQFQTDTSGLSIMGISFALLLFAFGMNQRNKLRYLKLAVIVSSIIFLAGCSKELQSFTVSREAKAFVRIAQVDKDGKASHSKTVEVVQE